MAKILEFSTKSLTKTDLHPKVSDVRSHFISELANEKFTVDRSGSKTIELIGASFIADEPAIFGKPNQSYIDYEIQWYDSMSTNIYDIYGEQGKDGDGINEPPAAWLATANMWGEINSNYGKLIFDDKYYQQYECALQELQANPDSRRACMIYNRPSIQIEFDENGKNDFICTNAVTYYIRDDYLHCVVQMRSNDVVFGYRNDYAWQKEVLNRLCDDLKASNSNLKVGQMLWQVQNLHVYERHFPLVK